MLAYPELKLKDVPVLFSKPPLYIKLLPLLALSYIISALRAPFMTEAWFGGEGNQTGVYFYLLLIPLFWLFSSAPRISNKYFAYLTTIICCLTIIEFLGFRPLLPLTEAYDKLATSYPAVTVGHRGQLAGFLLPLGGLLLFWFKEKSGNYRYWLLFLLFSVALACTTNTTAIIGLGLGMTILGIASSIRKKFRALLLIPVFLFGYWLHYPLNHVNRVLVEKKIVHSDSGIKDIGDTYTLKTRLLLWEAGLNMFKARPITGWGAQSYSLHWYDNISSAKADKLIKLELGIKPRDFYRRRNDVVIYGPDKKHVVPQRVKYFSAHNAYVDYLYSFGLLGTVTIVLIIVSILNTTNRRALPILLIAILPYSIYLMAWFITVPALGVAVMTFSYLFSQNKIPHKELMYEQQDPGFYTH